MTYWVWWSVNKNNRNSQFLAASLLFSACAKKINAQKPSKYMEEKIKDKPDI